MEWSFPEDRQVPEGGERRLLTGALKSYTFIDLTLDIPEQYPACQKTKKAPPEMQDYVIRLSKHFEIVKTTKGVRH